jgi:RNA-editing ligase
MLQRRSLALTMTRRSLARTVTTSAMLQRGIVAAPAPAPVMFSAVGSTMAAFHQRRSFMPLPKNDQDNFSAYNEIDLPSESRIESIRKAGMATSKDVWVALEKVHGSNLGIYLIDETQVRCAKRSGIMDPNENFFGYHVLLDDFRRFVTTMHQLIRQKYGLSTIRKVILHGELFGCKYIHPQVPKSDKWCTLPNGKKFPMAGVLIQKEPFPQYSPELHFFCFDVKYSVTGEERDEKILPYDDMAELCDQIPGFLYAKPIVRGTLDQCLAFDIENFITPLPALLGLGNFPLEGNYAEGIVVRHVKRGTPELEAKGVSSILKIRCSAFMELKHPNKQKELKETYFDTIRKAAVTRAGETLALSDTMLPAVESAANALLLNNVSEGRLSNVVSKINRESLANGTTTQDELTLLLAKDALKDFLKEGDDLILNTSITFRQLLIRNVYYESRKLVKEQWDGLLAAQAGAEAA